MHKEYDSYQGEVRKVLSQKIITEIVEEILLKASQASVASVIAGVGMFVLKNVQTLDGDTKNVWVEFNWTCDGTLNCSLVKLVVFDLMPDYILDRYNEIKRLEQFKPNDLVKPLTINYEYKKD